MFKCKANALHSNTLAETITRQGIAALDSLHHYSQNNVLQKDTCQYNL